MWLAFVFLGGTTALLGIFSLIEMKSREPELYERLGRPQLLVTTAKGLAYLYGFILFGEYRSKVVDLAVKKICVATQLSLIVWLSLIPLGLLFAVFFG
jgi:hypothetical protein